MIRRLLITVGVLSLAVTQSAWGEPLPTAAPEEVGLSSERLAQIGDMLQKGVDEGEIPGAVVLVARQGKIAYFEAVGMRDTTSSAPLEKDSIFRIYSMTKPFTSVAAMMLVEDGVITLADPVSKYLPAFKNVEVGVEIFDAASGTVVFKRAPAENPITVHDLLRHTAGFVYGIFGSTGVHKAYQEADMDNLVMSPAEFDERLASMPLINQPGTTWEYGHSTDVLGRVVEAASGMTLGEFFEARISGPLGLDDTAFWVSPEKQDRIAEPIPGNDPGVPLGYLDVTKPPSIDAGGQGLTSTVGDYARFAQMLLNGGELDGARLLGRKTVQFMAADHVGDLDRGPRFLPGPGYTFGLGFGVRTDQGMSVVPGSPGEFYWGGYAGTYFWIDPEEDLVAVYMMQSITNRNYYRLLFKSMVLQSIVDEG